MLGESMSGGGEKKHEENEVERKNKKEEQAHDHVKYKNTTFYFISKMNILF